MVQPTSAAAAPIPPTTLTAGEREMVLNAIATVSSENISLDELKSLMQDDDAVLCMLRGAAPLNGQALRPDFLSTTAALTIQCSLASSKFFLATHRLIARLWPAANTSSGSQPSRIK